MAAKTEVSTATTARVVSEPSTSSIAATTTGPPSVAPQTVVETTARPVLPFATLPTGEPVPVEIQFSSTQVLLTGTVPSQRAEDRLVALADTLTLNPVPVVNELTISPSVPDSVAVRIVERNAIVFNEGSDAVHADHARQLDRFVEILNTFSHATVLITAHADQRNDAERNQSISEERARSVAAYLVAHGIDVGRVSAVGAGESEPLILAETDEAHAVNRRVDFLFAGLLTG